MNLADRIYIAVHVALAAAAILRAASGTLALSSLALHLAWDVVAVSAVVLLSRKDSSGAKASRFWTFAHDWLPAIFFITVFEQIATLIPIAGGWHDSTLAAWDARVRLAPNLHDELWSKRWLRELLDFGYLAFYPMYPIVAAVLWSVRKRVPYVGGFRRLTDALSLGYLCCYILYFVFPTRSPMHSVGQSEAMLSSNGPLRSFVAAIQVSAGVHGNAFPSGHIMLAFVCLVFVWRYFPRWTLLTLFLNVLMCVAAVVDRYHYSIDVLSGALIGVVCGSLFWPDSKTEQLT